MPEISRCSTCVHDCDDAYKSAVTEILFIDNEDASSATAQDKARILELRVRSISHCALSTYEICRNLEDLLEGKVNLHG